MNILYLMAGKSIFFDENEYNYPKPLIEINDKTMIEHSIQNVSSLIEDKKFIFVLNENDCIKFHLDNAISLLIEKNNLSIIKLSKESMGALASSFFAIDLIDNNSELIICNYDQIIDNNNINNAVNYFRSNDAMAGIITFESIHPRWSFAKEDTFGNIVQTAEKDPISKNAIAGFYYFKKGSIYIEAAKKVILNNSHYNGLFYISSVFNELILSNFKILQFKINKQDYNTFYSPNKIKDYLKSYEKK